MSVYIRKRRIERTQQNFFILRKIVQRFESDFQKQREVLQQELLWLWTGTDGERNNCLCQMWGMLIDATVPLVMGQMNHGKVISNISRVETFLSGGLP